MLYRTNPVGIRATSQIGPNGAEMEKQIRELHERVRNAESDRAMWLEKQRIFVRQRRGIRKPKSIPWVGANNDNWPVTDGVLRRWKPGIISLILDSDPVVYFWAKKPQQVEPARLAQQFWHWEFFQIENVVRTVYKLVDMVGLHGMAFTHEGWDYHVERKSRIVEARQLFPEGIEAALEAFNAQIEAQNAQLSVAQQSGQAPPGVEMQQPLEADQFVRMVLAEQYRIGGSEEEDAQLNAAVAGLLQGAEYVTIYYMCEVRDKLAWAALDPRDVAIPTRGEDVEKGDFVAIAFRLTGDDIRLKVRDGVFLEEQAAKVLNRQMRVSAVGDRSEDNPFDERRGGSRVSALNDLDAIEGVEPRYGKNEPFKEVIWKVYCRLDIDGDSINEKVVMWYHPATSTVLSLTEYPFPFEEWPVTVYTYEHNDDRPYSSRGVAELLSTFQKQVNRLHNARLDAIQILLSPAFRVRTTTGAINRNIRFRPGMQIPVMQPDDYTPVPVDVTPLFQFLQEENVTKQLAEQYVGVFDASVLNQTAQERRTATEVEAVTANVSNISQADARLFQDSFSRSQKKLWKLWREFGADETFFRVTGEEQPREVKKGEIDYDFDIEPAGTPASTNRAIALSRAREALQLGLQDQSGTIDIGALWKHYFEVTDRNLAKLVVRSPEEARAAQLVIAAAQAAVGREAAPAQVPAF